MDITINGKPHRVQDNCNLIEVLQEAQITNQFGIAIAVNNIVISKIEWEKYTVNNKDNILIINAIFGG